MTQKLYVGNLPYRTTEDDLRSLFKKYGPIHSLILISDKETERSRGYGFVEIDKPKAGDALYDLSDTEFNGRSLKISVATGRNPKRNAAELKTTEKKSLVARITEKDAGKKVSAAPRRNRQTTVTEYMVADTGNYG